MAGPPVVQVHGARQLRSALRAAAGDLADLRRANAEAAAVVAHAGQSDAPRRTGLLAASVRPGATQSAAIVRAGSSRVPYAGVIHYGWEARHIPANPWLMEDAEQTQPTWLELYRDAIQALLDRVARTAHP